MPIGPRIGACSVQWLCMFHAFAGAAADCWCEVVYTGRRMLPQTGPKMYKDLMNSVSKSQCGAEVFPIVEFSETPVHGAELMGSSISFCSMPARA